MIKNKDVKSIQDLAKRQMEARADMLDVNSAVANGGKEENVK